VLATGDMVGDYRLGVLLAESRTATVYEAVHEHLGKPVALKLFHDAEAAERAARELKAVARLEHPGIVHVENLSLRSDPPFVALQLVSGRSLAQLLRESKGMVWQEALALFDVLMDALAYAHSKGVVHGNLKPENVLIAEDGRGLLSDFRYGGLLAGASGGLVISQELGDAEGSHHVGNRQYATPEQNKRGAVDEQTDIFSLGVLLFEALTGQRPQPGDRPSELVEGIPAELDRAFGKAFCRPDKRWRSVSEFRAALSPLLGARRQQESARTVAMPPPSSARVAGADAGSTVASSAPRNPVYRVELDRSQGADGSGDTSDPLVGKSFGNCKVISKLGAGGMGAVFLAHHTKLDKTVVLKTMLAGSDADVEDIARFQREARAAAQLEHPNIVSVYDFGEQDGIFYIIMRWVEGESLQERLEREEKLGAEEALTITREVAEGLARAHEVGLVHRDIKPANILLSRRGEVIVADFGLAKHVREGDGELTQSGAILGTPAFMAPEQCAGRMDVDGRADLYAVGLMLYAMVTGVLPIKGASALEILHNRLSEDVTPPSRFDPEIDPELESLVLALLVRDPAARLGSAEELVDRLEGLPAMSGGRGRRGTGRTPGVQKAVMIEDPQAFGKAVEQIGRALAIGDFETCKSLLDGMDQRWGHLKQMRDLRRRFERAQRSVVGGLARAQEMELNGQFDSALALMKEALEHLFDDPALGSRVAELAEKIKKRDGILRGARLELESGNGDAAAAAAEAAFEVLADDARVREFKVECQRVPVRVRNLVKDAEGEAKVGHIVAALQQLDRAIQLAPRDDALKEIRADYQRVADSALGRRRRMLAVLGGVLVLGLGSVLGLGLRMRSQAGFAAAQSFMAEGQAERALEALRKARSPLAVFLPALELAQLEEAITERIALDEVLGKDSAGERVAGLEGFLAAYGGGPLAHEAEEVLGRARLVAKDDARFKLALSVMPMEARFKALESYCSGAQNGDRRHVAEARKYVVEINERRAQALKRAKAEELKLNWVRAASAYKDALGLGLSVKAELAAVEAKQSRLRAHLLAARRAVAGARFESAIRSYKAALALGASVERDLQKAITSDRRAKQREALLAARTARRKRQWDQAISGFERAKTYGAQVDADVRDCRRRRAEALASKAERAKRYDQAITYWREAARYGANVERRIEGIEWRKNQQKINDLISKGREAEVKKSYSSAIGYYTRAKALGYSRASSMILSVKRRQEYERKSKVDAARRRAETQQRREEAEARRRRYEADRRRRRR